MRSILLSRTTIVRWAATTSLFGAALITGCNSTSNDGFVGAPVLIKVTGQTDISAQVATDAGPYVFTVVDTAGTGVQGVTVNFTISGPATLATTSAVTDQGGSVLTSVHFAQTVGTVTITATASGITAPAVVHTSSYAAPPSKFTIAGGNNQIGVHGTALSEAIAVLVTDQYDNPVNSILISLQPSAGTVGTASARTGLDGRLTTTYTLPATPGVQTITASALFNGTTINLTFTETGT